MRFFKRDFFRFARIFAIVLVGLVVSLFVALSRVNLETLRGEVAHALSSATGLPVEIRGEIHWKFSLTPRVVLSDVAIPAKDWAANEDGVRIDQVEARINLLSLLGTTASVSDLTLVNPLVYLEENAEGEYSLESSRVPAFAGMTNTTNQEDGPAKFPFDSDWGIDSVKMENPKFVFIDAGGKTEFEAEEIFLRYKKTDGYIEYVGRVALDDGQEYSFIASLLPLDAARKVYPVRVAIANKLTPVIANLALEQTSKLPIDFIVKGKIADAQAILKRFDPDVPKIAPMTLNISGGMGHSKLTLHQSSISFGKSDLSVSGNISWGGKKPMISAKLRSKKFILGEVFTELYGTAKTPWKRPNRPLNVFKDTPLYSEYLNLANADIAVDLASLVMYRNLSVENISARANVKDGELSVRMDAGFAGGKVRAALLAYDDEGAVVARGAGMGQGIQAGKILESVGEKNIITGLPADFEFYLQGRGKDLSELMASVAGPLQVRSVGAGTALPDAAEYLYGQDFLTSLRHSVQDMVTAKNKYDKVDVSCAVVNLKIRRGVVETERGIALQTSAVNMRAAGRADLGKETLDASMVSTPVRGLKISFTGNIVNSMEFTGNMAEPDIKFNGRSLIERTAATTGIGMILLAPFTGGLSLVAGAGIGFLAGDLLSNWLEDDHPCDTAIKKGAPEIKGDPEFINRPLSELVAEMIK